MILEWLSREGMMLVSWWLLTAVAGAAALPLLWRLLPGLPDRGALLMRAAGLLLVGFTFWLLGSFGFLANEPGGIVVAWVIVLAISLTVYFTRRDPFDLRAWWREHRVAFLVGEILFIALLVGWGIIRAHNPDTSSTEKPMDLMFISSIMRSESFPPNDGWMAGYAISYYYFGYLIAAMLGTMSSLSSTNSYSMMIVLLVALTAQSAFGLAYNLVRANAPRALYAEAANRFQRTTRAVMPSTLPAIATGLLAAFFVVLLGNFQAPLIEIPYQTRTASEAYLAFWDTPERSIYPEREAARAQGIPDSDPVVLEPRDLLSPDAGTVWLWWWRASRVIQDRDLIGTPIGIQPIDEFPMFSFLLADSHPHVMALPFVLFALALAFNVVRSGGAPDRTQIVFYALCLGGLIFFNTWDGPIYMAILVMADIIRRLRTAPDWKINRADLIDIVLFAVAIVGLAVLFYLPFLIGFRSQAGGFLPNWEFPTLFRQYFIVFGPFILLLTPFVAVEVWRGRETLNLRTGALTAVAVLGGLILLMLFLSVIASLVGVGTPQINLGAVLARRISHIVLTVVLLAGITLVIARLFPRKSTALAGIPQPFPYSASTGFVFILIAAGLGLTLVPDYVYLRDNFGVRINTVFKFYYAAWVVFSIAAAYGVHSVISDVQERAPAALRAAMGAITLVVITLGSVYPILSVHYRTLQESGRLSVETQPPLTLDGGRRFITRDPGGSDYAAIQCLAQRVVGDDVVIVEAVEGTYNPNVGRVAALTGMPVLFNWPGHQVQWRGATFSEVAGSRQGDIQTLYTSDDWNTVAGLLNRYGVDYIFFGITERDMYSPDAETKFRDRLTPICEYEGSRFYAVEGST